MPRWVEENVPKGTKILDFGSGPAAQHTTRLREAGFTNITAHEFGDNVREGVHDPKALSKKYDVVFASNVLNVQSSETMLRQTLESIEKAVRRGGFAVFNYPTSPRKAGMKDAEVKAIVDDVFYASERPDGVKRLNKGSGPMWGAHVPLYREQKVPFGASEQNPVRAASTRGSLSGIDRKAVRAGDVLRYRNVSYIVDSVMKPEDYTAMGLSHIADLMRRQRVISELVVFKPSPTKHRPSIAKPEKRYAMKVYENGKLSAPQSKTLGQVPAGKAV